MVQQQGITRPGPSQGAGPGPAEWQGSPVWGWGLQVKKVFVGNLLARRAWSSALGRGCGMTALVMRESTDDEQLPTGVEVCRSVVAV